MSKDDLTTEEKSSKSSTKVEDAVSPPHHDHQDHVGYPRPATTQDIQNLPHVMTEIPPATWLLVFVGSAAACARYGIATPFQNYIQNPPGDPKLPGALGLGEEEATMVTNLFTVFLYLAPLPIGILSDAWLGRLRTMNLSLAILLLGCAVLVVTALPISLNQRAGLGGLIASMLLIGIGQGGLSAVMFAFIGDQIPDSEPMTIQKRGDKFVVADRKITLQFVFNAYFWGNNLGSLSVIGTTFLERSSYWSAYLMPTGVLAISVVPLFFWSSQFVRPSLQDNPVPRVIQVSLIACRNGFHLSAAHPDRNENVRWTSSFIHEFRRGLRACQAMILFIVFFLCYSQVNNNLISQAGQMELSGISNDTIFFVNVLGVVVLSPIIQSIMTLLRRKGISFGPMRRITVAFILSARALGYTAGLQKLIYSRGPCYSFPLECPAANRDNVPEPNHVNVWLQTPIYILLAGAEILGYVSMTEYAYAEAPANMKAIVQALLQLTLALGYGLAIALGPVSKNPWLVILYGCLAGVMGICAIVFWLIFRKRDEWYESIQKHDQNDASEA